MSDDLIEAIDQVIVTLRSLSDIHKSRDTLIKDKEQLYRAEQRHDREIRRLKEAHAAEIESLRKASPFNPEVFSNLAASVVTQKDEIERLKRQKIDLERLLQVNSDEMFRLRNLLKKTGKRKLQPLGLPEGYRVERLTDGWYIVDRAGAEIMGPFDSKDAAYEGYIDDESRPAQ